MRRRERERSRASQLGEGERLDEVVIGISIEAAHSVATSSLAVSIRMGVFTPVSSRSVTAMPSTR
ncbi:MAG: hypothetical protein U0531_00855 [Dehalococcoidia bacterium]